MSTSPIHVGSREEQRRAAVERVWAGYYRQWGHPGLVKLQAHVRGRLARRRVKLILHGRVVIVRGADNGRQAAARCIQRHWRGWQVRQEYPDLRDEAVEAATLIQKHARAMQARRLLQRIRRSWEAADLGEDNDGMKRSKWPSEPRDSFEAFNHGDAAFVTCSSCPPDEKNISESPVYDRERLRVSTQTGAPKSSCADQQERYPQHAISSKDAHPEVEVSSHARKHPLEPHAGNGLLPLTHPAASEDNETVLTARSQRILPSVPNVEREEQVLLAAASLDASKEGQDASMLGMNPPEQDRDAAETQSQSSGALERARERGQGHDAVNAHTPSCGALERLLEREQDPDAAAAQIPPFGALESQREREQAHDAEAQTLSCGDLERMQERETDGCEGLEGDGGRSLGPCSPNAQVGAAREMPQGSETQEKCPRESSAEEQEEEIKTGMTRQGKGLQDYRHSGILGTAVDAAREKTLQGLKSQQKFQMRSTAENQEKEDGRIHDPLNRLRNVRKETNDDEDAGIPEEIGCLDGDSSWRLPPLTEINGGAVSVSTTARFVSGIGSRVTSLPPVRVTTRPSASTGRQTGSNARAPSMRAAMGMKVADRARNRAATIESQQQQRRRHKHQL